MKVIEQLMAHLDSRRIVTAQDTAYLRAEGFLPAEVRSDEHPLELLALLDELDELSECPSPDAHGAGDDRWELAEQDLVLERQVIARNRNVPRQLTFSHGGSMGKGKTDGENAAV